MSKIKRLQIFLIVVLIVNTGFGQSFGRLQYEAQEAQPVQAQTMESFEEIFAFEEKIDPDAYILGPGDELGLNILTTGNMTYPLKVTPTGDLFIPAVGVVRLAGYTLTEAFDIVEDYIHAHAYPGAKVNLVLINVRIFKIQTVGALNKPGFIQVTPLDRLSDILILTKGFHQLAREFSIEVIRKNGEKLAIDYLNYVRTGELSNNPVFQEGDKIIVPFGDMKTEGVVLRGAVRGSGYDIIEPNETLGSFLQRRVKFNKNADLESVVITRKVDGKIGYIGVKPQEVFTTKLRAGDTIDIQWEKGVMINGFVQTAGGFGFFPGYTAADYISMAGGNTVKGNPNKCRVNHRDGSTEYGQDVIIRRGDVIVVPRTMKDYFLGDTSALQILVSAMTIYMTFLAIGA